MPRTPSTCTDLNASKNEPGPNWWKREITGQHDRNVLGEWDAKYGERQAIDAKERRDEPATNDAKRWSGWGTALKPAIEPAVLARKPLSEPTVAANVLRWGTGALNIDACRYAFGDPAWPGPQVNEHLRGEVCNKTADRSHSSTVHLPASVMPLSDERGRWSANIYACPKPAGTERAAGTEHLPQEEKAQLAGAVNSDDPVSARLRRSG